MSKLPVTIQVSTELSVSGQILTKRQSLGKKKLIICLASSALSLKKCAHLHFLLEICHILFFLFRKVCKMILNLLDNFKESVNHAFF